MGARTSFVFFLILKFWRIVLVKFTIKKQKFLNFFVKNGKTLVGGAFSVGWVLNQNIGGYQLFFWLYIVKMLQ